MTFFTLFVVLPTEEVCTLHDITSGITVHDIKSKLELCAGLPSQIYVLNNKSGEVLPEDCTLEFGLNVWDGFLLRADLKDEWRLLFEAVANGDLDTLLREIQAQLIRSHDLTTDIKKEKAKKATEEKGCVALYLASWDGSLKMCHTLLTVGVNPNSATPFNRTALFVAAVRDNDFVLELLLGQGAHMFVKDCNGDTPLDIAKRNLARQSVKIIHKMMKVQLGTRRKTFSNEINSTCSQFAGRVNVSVDDDIVSVSTPRSRPLIAQTGSTCTVATILKQDLNFNTHFPACDVDSSPKPFSDKGRTRSLNIDVNKSNERLYVPRSSISTPRRSNYISQSEERDRTTQLTNGAEFKVAVSVPHSSRNKGLNKTHELVTWTSPLKNSTFLRIKSAPRDTKRQNQILSSSEGADNPCPDNEREEDALVECRNNTIPIKDLNTEVHNTVIIPSNEHENGINTNIDVLAVDGARSLDRNYSTSLQSQDPVQKTKDIRPVTADVAAFRIKKCKRKRTHFLTTAIRQIQLAEHQKRLNSDNERSKVTFQQWLRKKQEEDRQTSSQGDSDDSSTRSADERSSQPFQVWLKNIRDRSKLQQNSSSATSLNHRKIRPNEGLIEIHNTNTDQAIKSTAEHSYMHAFKEWRETHWKCKGNHNILIDAIEAKKRLVENRKLMMATAITFNDWMSHLEERKQLLRVIHQAEEDKLHESNNSKLTKGTSRAISFPKWKERIQKPEAFYQSNKSRERDVTADRLTKVVSFVQG